MCVRTRVPYTWGLHLNDTEPTIKRLVNLTGTEHDTLVEAMFAGRQIHATTQEQVTGLAARNKLVVAYMPYIRARASNLMPADGASEDREQEAYLRTIEAFESYNPRTQVPFGAWLEKAHAVTGEALKLTGAPEATISRAGRRSAHLSGESLPRPWSLDMKIAGDENLNLTDIVADQRVDVELEVELREREAAVRAVMLELPAADAKILSDHFGLGAAAGMTLEAIGAELGVSKVAAFKRLRRASKAAAVRLTRHSERGTEPGTPPLPRTVELALARL
jgi:RNA polymerase sigma factor (sigma-70 family)